MAELVEKEFEAIQLEPDIQVKLDSKKFVAQLKPIKLYCLPNGTIDQKPSYMFLMVDAQGLEFVAQISHKMLEESFKEIGKTWSVQ